MAVTSLRPKISADSCLFTDVMSYHVLPGNLSGQIVTYLNVTAGRTYLSDPLVVTLDGNQSQVLIWSQFNDNRIHILNQEYVSHPPGSTASANFQAICQLHCHGIEHDQVQKPHHQHY